MNKSSVLCSSLFLLLCSTTSSAYYTQQANIYTEKGDIVTINGVNWSGFQDTNIFQGLQGHGFYSYQNHLGLLDLLVHPYDYPQIGIDKAIFKTIRFPIQPGILYDDANEVDINKSLSSNFSPVSGNGLFCRSWQSDGKCGKAVSSKQAFWTALDEMQKQGLRTLIDIHHGHGYSDDKRDGSVYNIDQYQRDMSLLAQEIGQRALTNVIGIDVFNEPYRLNWFQAHDGQVPWTKVIATAANAIYENNPELLLFVEGSGGGNDDIDEPVICIPKTLIVDDPNAYNHYSATDACGTLDKVEFKGNWGEDFKPLLNLAKAQNNSPEFDIQRFKEELIKQGITPQALNWLLGDEQAQNAHIVFSPHVYPAEVGGWESAPGRPSQMRFDWSWGFLSRAGYPVVLGEASWKTAKGKAFFTQALMPYMADNIKTQNVFFWAIGYLGDTATAISPHTGEWNKDVYDTLSSFF